MDYAQLSQAIQDYLETTETSFVANIPVFVKAAEQRIYNTVYLPSLRKNSAGAMVTGTSTITLPTDWLANFEFSITVPGTGVQYLVDKDVNFLREAYPSVATTGVPKYYATVSQTQLQFGPTPDVDYVTSLDYYAYPESIVTASTTWLGDNFNTVLLYGSIREAYVFLKGEIDLQAEYEKKYQEAIMQLKRLGDGLNRRDAYRSGLARVAVT
jgi:hypothetical protein